MKTSFKRFTGLLVMGVCVTLVRVTDGQSPSLAKTDNPPSTSTRDQIKALERLNDREFEALAVQMYNDQQEIQTSLLNQLGSSNKEARCRAAFLLGEYRFPRAASKLAQIINLEADIRSNPSEWFWGQYPAFEALVKIGNPSIPPVTRNLEDSDDVLVRNLSLKVLYYVDGDKEVVKLRLQRALDAQKDPAKQARLQFALKSLPEMQIGN